MKNHHHQSISRRDFLRLSVPAFCGLVLSGCSPISRITPIPQLTFTPTAEPRDTPTIPPSQTPTIISIPTPTSTACQARARFSDPADSPYILPYPTGKSYRVIQTYCFTDGSHVNQLAYDFAMPIGEDVTAARAGEVRISQGNKPDKSAIENIGQFNYIYIEHEDGTCAFYAHLKQDSIIVNYGDHVDAGQKIAETGNSGFTGGKPQLHFGVYQSYPPYEGDDLAVNFRNAGGKLDPLGGLMLGVYYDALPVQE